MATTSNPNPKTQSKIKTEPNPLLISADKCYNLLGIGFQIGVVGDTAFQFLKGLSASSSPKAVSAFHRLAGACKNVRLRPHSIIPAFIAAGYALNTANDDPFMLELQNIREDYMDAIVTPSASNAFSQKNETLKEWFCASAFVTGFHFCVGLNGGFYFHLFKAVNGRNNSPVFPGGKVISDAFRVGSKVAAWFFLSQTLTYASGDAFRDSGKRGIYIAEAVATGLLSVRRGLPDAAAIAGLTGGLLFLFSRLIKYLPDDYQAGCKKSVEYLDYNIQDINQTQEVANTDRILVEAREDS